MSEATAPTPEFGSTGLLRVRSDERLARRAAEGDPGAFEAIYKRYHQDLYRFCLAMLGRPQDAQDALQNTMVKALRALPGETRRIKLKPWLYRIARNEAVEILRRRRDSAELGEEHTAPDGEIAETAEARERLRRLLDDLQELPDRQRAMLVMRELGGLGFDQIGDAFETSGSVARQTLYEARLSLRQMEAGREMDCERVMRKLSDADGRVFRRREIRAHLRNCADCRAFRDSIGRRQGELAAMAPLPVAASAGLLHGILGGGTAGGGAVGGGGLVGTIGAGTGKVVAGSALAKSAATAAIVAAVGVTAADRGGLIDVPLPGGGSEHGAATKVSTPASSSSLGAAAASDHPSSQPAADVPSKAKGGGASAEGQGSASAKSVTAHANRRSHSHAASRQHNAGARSPSSARGRPSELPETASHGQQTAAGHKPPQATGNPAEAGHAEPKSPTAPPSRPVSPPSSEGKGTTAPPPPAKPVKPSTEGGAPQTEDEAPTP